MQILNKIGQLTPEIWHILFLKALWPLKSQKWLDRIFSKCIFLKALDLNQVPMGVRAMAQTENLTAVGLGCECHKKLKSHS